MKNQKTTPPQKTRTASEVADSMAAAAAQTNLPIEDLKLTKEDGC